MADVFSKAKRSEVMALIRGSGNKDTELTLAKIFRRFGVSGWRRQLQVRFQVSGVRFQVRPDFIFPKLKLAVFVDGCFWHGCPKHGTKPKQNASFWAKKLAANKARDRLVTRRLRAAGWRVVRVWEHELREAEKVAASFRRSAISQ